MSRNTHVPSCQTQSQNSRRTHPSGLVVLIVLIDIRCPHTSSASQIPRCAHVSLSSIIIDRPFSISSLAARVLFER